MHGSAAELFAPVGCYLAQESITNLRIAVVGGNFVTVVLVYLVGRQIFLIGGCAWCVAMRLCEFYCVLVARCSTTLASWPNRRVGGNVAREVLALLSSLEECAELGARAAR